LVVLSPETPVRSGRVKLSTPGAKTQMDSGEFPPGSLIFHICDFKTTYWRFAALRLSWIGDSGRLPDPSDAGCKSCHLCPLRSRVGQVPVLLDKAAVAQVIGGQAATSRHHRPLWENAQAGRFQRPT
jgi:hypothetical protein